MGRFWRHITSDSQLRWIAPDKGVIHLATGAVVNAVWDLWAKSENKPVWRLVADMSPEQLVRCIDFRYITDCITMDEALSLLRERAHGKVDRLALLQKMVIHATPLRQDSLVILMISYADPVRKQLMQDFLKVGRNLQDDIRRLKIARAVIGPDRQLMIDANQMWDVDTAINWVRELAFANPWFIEEPTSPDDVEGYRKICLTVGPVKVATGEMCQNRIVFKQLIMREAIDVVQIDACRLGGVNEALAVMVMAVKYNLPVCPHAGGVGLCE